MGARNGLIGLGKVQLADAYECGDEPSVSIKHKDFLYQLKAHLLLRRDSAPWS
jgi:hypothetical protein